MFRCCRTTTWLQGYGCKGQRATPAAGDQGPSRQRDVPLKMQRGQHMVCGHRCASGDGYADLPVAARPLGCVSLLPHAAPPPPLLRRFRHAPADADACPDARHRLHHAQQPRHAAGGVQPASASAAALAVSSTMRTAPGVDKAKVPDTLRSRIGAAISTTRGLHPSTRVPLMVTAGRAAPRAYGVRVSSVHPHVSHPVRSLAQLLPSLSFLLYPSFPRPVASRKGCCCCCHCKGAAQFLRLLGCCDWGAAGAGSAMLLSMVSSEGF